jgi:hypothetical protein
LVNFVGSITTITCWFSVFSVCQLVILCRWSCHRWAKFYYSFPNYILSKSAFLALLHWPGLPVFLIRCWKWARTGDILPSSPKRLGYSTLSMVLAVEFSELVHQTEKLPSGPGLLKVVFFLKS